MNEVRNILVGFDFGEKVSQLCYYDRREGEPVSLPVKVGTGQYTFPNALSKKPGQAGPAGKKDPQSDQIRRGNGASADDRSAAEYRKYLL